MREFSLTSTEGVLLRMSKNGGENFILNVGPTKIELSWSQLEMLRSGCEDMSDSELKKKDS